MAERLAWAGRGVYRGGGAPITRAALGWRKIENASLRRLTRYAIMAYVIFIGSAQAEPERQEPTMTNTFRACYFVHTDEHGNFSDILLTSEEQVSLSDAELIEAAVAEAYMGNIIGDECPYVTEADLRAGLEIGDYQER